MWAARRGDRQGPPLGRQTDTILIHLVWTGAHIPAPSSSSSTHLLLRPGPSDKASMRAALIPRSRCARAEEDVAVEALAISISISAWCMRAPHVNSSLWSRGLKAMCGHSCGAFCTGFPVAICQLVRGHWIIPRHVLQCF